MKPKADSGHVLRMLFWETTVHCNLACAHCRRLESNEADIGDLSTDRAELLLEQLTALGRRQTHGPVLVFSGGEPFCRVDLFALLRQAREKGLTVAVATNGTMIDAAQARRLREEGVARVSVSLDGATAEVHDRMRRIPGAFDRALAGIRHLHEQRVPFQINVTLTQQNVRQLREVYDLVRTLGAAALHLFMLVPVGCGQVLAQTDMLGPEQSEQTLREIYTLESRGEMPIKVTCGPHYERVKRQLVSSVPVRASPETPRGVTASAHPPSKGCLAGLGVLFVSHRGDVYPCGYLPVHCGNILEQSLIDIWDGSPDLARMREAGSLEGKCGLCEYKQVCGGCRARAYSISGNYLGEEPFCAYQPRAGKRAKQ